MKPASQTQLENLVPSYAKVAPLFEKHYCPSLISHTVKCGKPFILMKFL